MHYKLCLEHTSAVSWFDLFLVAPIRAWPTPGGAEKPTMDMSWIGMIKARGERGTERKESHAVSYLLGLQDACVTACDCSHF